MDTSYNSGGGEFYGNMFDQNIYKRNESNLNASSSVSQYNNREHGNHYNMNDQAFCTPSFGDEEFNIPTMNAHLHAQEQQQQHSHQPHQVEQHQYPMHNNAQQRGMSSDLQQSHQQQQQLQYNQWHQDPNLSSHSNTYQMPTSNQPTYNLLSNPSANIPNANLHVMQPPHPSRQMPPQMSPQMVSGAPMGVPGGGYLGKSPPQASDHHLNNNNNINDPATTSDDSDDAIPINTMKRPSPDAVYDGDTNNSKVAAVLLTKKPKVVKKKKKRDPNEPQKPVSAYALFFRDTQAAIKGQNPNASFGEVSKIVASMWDVLPTEHKNVYKKKTEAAKKDYLKALAAYRASLVSKGTEGEQQQLPTQQQPVYSHPTSLQQQHVQHHTGHLMNHSEPSHSSHGQRIPQAVQMAPKPDNFSAPYSSPYKSPQQPIMQMPPHLQHHNQPPMHAGQAQCQPPLYLMQSNPMTATHQQQQHQQMMDHAHRTGAGMNGMMDMGMAPPPPHYMNQQMQSHGQQQPLPPGHSSQQPQQQQQQHQLGGHLSSHYVAPSQSGSPPHQNAIPTRCIRHGCQNPAIVNSDWEDEYCSNECVITHCRDIFSNWVQTNNPQQQPHSAVK